MVSINRGFTLIELLVTIAVLGIAISIAAPSFNNQIRNNKSVTLNNDFVSALNFARTESIKRSRRVSICPTTDKVSCDPDGEWSNAWIVFLDDAASESDDPVITDTNTSILRYWEKKDPKMKIGFAPEGTIVAAKVKSGLALTITKTIPTNFVRFTGLGTLAKTVNDQIAFKSKIENCSGFSTAIIFIGVSGMVSSNSVAC